MVETRRGLEIIIEAASTLFDFKSMQRLAEGVLTQIGSLLNAHCAGILVLREATERARDLLGAGRLRLLQPLHRDRGLRNHRERPAQAGRGGVHAPPARVLGAPLGALYQDAERPRGRGRARSGARTSPTPTGRWSRSSAAACRSPSTTSSCTSSCRRRTPASRSAWRSAPQDLTSANRRLAAQWARLRQANTFKSEILGTVAHDLKNPLGVILGRTEILKEMIAGRRRARRQYAGADRLYPQRRQPADRDGRRSGLRRHGGRARHHDPARADRSRRPGAGSRRRQPAARLQEAADHHGRPPRPTTSRLRCRPHP